MAQDHIQSSQGLTNSGEILISKDLVEEATNQKDDSRLFVFEFAKMVFSLPLNHVEEVIESDKIEEIGRAHV